MHPHSLRRALVAIAIATLAIAALPGVASATAGGDTPLTPVVLPITPPDSFVGDSSASTGTPSGNNAVWPKWNKVTWFSYSPAADERIAIRATSIAPGGWDNTLEIWTTAGTLVVQNDDSYGLDALVTANLLTGTDYVIGLGGFNAGSKGTATLSFANSVPDAPAGVAAVAGNTTATVSWTAPDDHYAPITQYKIYCDTNADPASALPCKTISGFPPAASTTVTGRVNGTAVRFRVVAVNGIGSSADSTPSSDVTPAGTPQTITFAEPDDQVVGTTLELVATASSGQTVAFAAADDCTIVGTTLTPSGAGSCTVTATQAGTATIAAATPVVRTFVVTAVVPPDPDPEPEPEPGPAPGPTTTTAPVPATTAPTTIPGPPAVLGVGIGLGTGSGTAGPAATALFITSAGRAVPVAMPSSAQRALVHAMAAVDDHDAIAVTADGHVFTTNATHDFGEITLPALNGPIVNVTPLMQLVPVAAAKGDDAWTVGGYWLVGDDGGVFTFGAASFHGSAAGQGLNQPVVALTQTPSQNGYWLVAADGGVFTFGDARFYGSTGGRRLGAPIVSLVATATGRGYWLVAADGEVHAFGDATDHGSARGARVIGAASTPSGDGYWLVTDRRTLIPFGDAS